MSIFAIEWRHCERHAQQYYLYPITMVSEQLNAANSTGLAVKLGLDSENEIDDKLLSNKTFTSKKRGDSVIYSVDYWMHLEHPLPFSMTFIVKCGFTTTDMGYIYFIYFLLIYASFGDSSSPPNYVNLFMKCVHSLLYHTHTLTRTLIHARTRTLTCTHSRTHACTYTYNSHARTYTYNSQTPTSTRTHAPKVTWDSLKRNNVCNCNHVLNVEDFKVLISQGFWLPDESRTYRTLTAGRPTITVIWAHGL